MEILAFELEFLGSKPERVGVLKLMREAIGSSEVSGFIVTLALFIVEFALICDMFLLLIYALLNDSENSYI